MSLFGNVHTKHTRSRSGNIEKPEMKKTVEIIESSFVVPSEETPRGRLWLSNLDQVAKSIYTCTVYLYNNNNARDFFSVDVLKAALTKALVLFYPLAGRLIVGEDNRKVVDCNAEGALFVVARSEHSSDSINFEPSLELRSLFVPTAPSPYLLLMLQVTYLKCGGVVLGAATNHGFIDGRSAFNFFKTWASIARGDLKSIVLPSFDHTTLHARSPPNITTDHPEYPSERAKNTTIPVNGITSNFKLSKKQITSLKSRCDKGSRTTGGVSTFCIVAALVWKCYCIAKQFPPGVETSLMFTADTRKRLCPPLPENFFGNGVMRTSARTEVSKVTLSPFHVAAEAVKAAVDGVTDAFVRSFIDYAEEKGGKILSQTKEMRESDLRIATISGMPVYDADLGWGAPTLWTWAEPIGNVVAYINNEPGRDGSIRLLISLDSVTTMHQFEKVFYNELCFKNSEVEMLELPAE